MKVVIDESGSEVSVNFKTVKAPCAECSKYSANKCTVAGEEISTGLIGKCEDEKWRE